MDFLVGEGQYVRFLLAFVVVLALAGLMAWLVRRFGSERLGAASTRGRQPRLAVIDAASVDGRRRLILIRRDNVEHLLMIGGPTDVVIEPNIVRAAAVREVAPSRPHPLSEAMPRPVPAGETSHWPPQVEPTPSPPLRPQRQPPGEPSSWHAAAETAPPPPPPAIPAQARLVRAADPLAGLAAELTRQTAPLQRPQREREAAREPPPLRAPQPAAGDAPFSAGADQNLAEMAQRLEAALRRNPKVDPKVDPQVEGKPRTAAPMVAPAAAPPEPEPVAETEPVPEPAAEVAEARPARTDAKPAREAKTAARPSVYDSLEQEMASLLGRPNKT